MEEGLQRRLTSRQLTMIAIGGAIGVGLFLGSTVTINLAGPGVIVTYAIGLGLGPWPAIGLRNLTAGAGGFLPHGWLGVWLALTLVITSYMGVEVIAVTAGEAQNPQQSIPRAMRTMVARLIMFYVLAIT